MLKVVESEVAEKPVGGGSLLDELVRDGARQMLAAALQAEVAAYIDQFTGEVDERGHRMVVRNGYHQQRAVVTGAGAVTVTAPRVNDVLGTADQDSLQVQQLVNETGCVGVVVDYRLAPETPHPGPVEDCYAALLWLFGEADALGVDARRIAVAGGSAGGGLAAGLCLLARDRAEVSVAFQLLIYPMLDDRTVIDADPHPFAGEFVWTAKSNQFGWAALLGQEPGGPGVSPYAAPARAETLAGLPPTYLDVGTLDLFFEEDLEYARRLARAGVPVELHVYPGAFHGYQQAPASDVAGTHHRNVIAALRRGLSVE